jgi:hypothetical protein
MKGAGPHIPERGWERRWVLQAFDLAFAAPAAMAILIVGAFVLGLSFQAATTLIPGFWMTILAGAAVSALAAPLTTLIHGLLLHADGHERQSTRCLLRSGTPGIAPTFLIHSAFAVIFARFPEAGDAASSRDDVEAIFTSGIMAFTSAHVALTIVNPLWLALLPSLGMPAREAAFASTRMVGRMLTIWIALCMGINVTGTVALSLPAMLGMPLLMIMTAWTHVAARDIFGGISENGLRRRSVPVNA